MSELMHSKKDPFLEWTPLGGMIFVGVMGGIGYALFKLFQAQANWRPPR